MKKLVVLSPSDIEYVLAIAKKVSDPRAKIGNFSKGLRKLIADHRDLNTEKKIEPVIVEVNDGRRTD